MEHIIYLKILLYFNDTTIEGKTLDFYEYEQWAKIFIKFSNIRMNELEGIVLENIKILTDTVQTLFLYVFCDETFQNKHELEVIKVKNIWFYKIWKCRQLKKSNKNWEIKLGEKIAEKEMFLKKN